MATLNSAEIRAGVKRAVNTGEAQRRREAVGPRGPVARRLRVNEITLYRWETGRREPQGHNLIAYAKFLERLGVDLRSEVAGAEAARAVDAVNVQVPEPANAPPRKVAESAGRTRSEAA